MKTNTAVISMVVAFLAIGMTGGAVAGSNMNYDVDFSSVGTGSAVISTYTPVGFDVQDASWRNCVVGGHQDGAYNNGGWTYINRHTTIRGDQNGALAMGTILTQTMPTTPVADPTKGAFVQAVATYRDNAAGGSYVKLVQDAKLYDSDMPVVSDAGYEGAYVNTDIDGYAYGNAKTMVTGAVYTQTDGNSNAATGISATVHDGNLNMGVHAIIIDDTSDRESGRVTYDIRVRSPGDTADGLISGYASVNGVQQGTMSTLYTNSDITATGYFYAVTI